MAIYSKKFLNRVVLNSGAFCFSVPVLLLFIWCGPEVVLEANQGTARSLSSRWAVKTEQKGRRWFRDTCLPPKQAQLPSTTPEELRLL